jgi:hypothetical protein
MKVRIEIRRKGAKYIFGAHLNVIIDGLNTQAPRSIHITGTKDTPLDFNGFFLESLEVVEIEDDETKADE